MNNPKHRDREIRLKILEVVSLRREETSPSTESPNISPHVIASNQVDAQELHTIEKVQAILIHVSYKSLWTPNS